MTQALLTSSFWLGLAREEHWHEIKDRRGEKLGMLFLTLPPLAWPWSVEAVLLTLALAFTESANFLGFQFLWALVNTIPFPPQVWGW